MKLRTDKTARLLSYGECYDAWMDDDTDHSHNPPKLLEYQTDNGKQVIKLSAGSNDDVMVYHSPGEPERYVLTINHSMDYCGLEIVGLDGEPVADMFVQYAFELRNMGLPNELEHAPYNIVKSLAQHLEY